MSTITQYWNGDGPLWRIFWIWGVIGSWILAGLFALGAANFGVTWGLFLVAAVVMVAYTIWILISVWRCADNTQEKHWSPISRALTVAWALNVLFVGGFLFFDLYGSGPS